ncbi:MAG: DUF3365 domain-containing protein [Pirellulales bacterium]|nr:DUF3365 domain-containing protein [Pirellulales bacterium]
MKSISTKFIVVVGLFAIAFSGFLFLQTWFSTRKHMEKMTEKEGKLALEFDLAIRKYVAENIRPEMEKRVEEGEFIPESMSTSFVARSIFDEVRKKFPDYVLKFSSDNPRNPANMAGPEEMEVIEYFRNNPGAERLVGYITIDGKEYLAHFSPRKMNESCLRCHGLPEDAPVSMLSRYGREAGFYRKVDDVIATDTVAIPLDHVDAALSSQVWKQLSAVAVGMILLFGAIILVFRWVVSRRLDKLTRHFEGAASQNEDATIAPVKDSGDDEIGILASSFNAVASKIGMLHSSLERRVEERTAELEKSKEEYVAVTNLTGDLIIKCDTQGRWTFLNDGACNFWGMSREQMLGNSYEDLLHPDDAEMVKRKIEDMFRTGRPIRGLRNRQKTPGGWRTVEWNCYPILDEAGKTTGLQATGRDITDQQKAEDDLRDYAQALATANEALEISNVAIEAANQAKSEFLANMSHELRTPMTAILGYSEILLDNLEREEDIEAAFTVKRNGEYLLDIINGILDLSKIEAGKLEIDRAACSPIKVVADVASLMRVRADGKNLPLAIEYVGKIPETIQCDSTRLRQILINLVGNAIKFTETGSVRLVTRLVQSNDVPPHLRFDVIDTGMGITPEQAAKLFKPFSQGDSSTSREHGGTGLGLAISKRLAKMLGGDISLSSVPNEGSTFSLTVDTGPLDGVTLLDHVSEALSKSNCDQKKKPASDVKLNCRILLAEDGPDNQRLISFIFRKAGADVTVAENGLIAYGFAQAAQDEGRPFDVILMDMQMPVMDGYEATRLLRESGYKGKIVALTANAMTGDDKKCIDAGCDDYCSKPIDQKVLLPLIAEYIKQNSQVNNQQ